MARSVLALLTGLLLVCVEGQESGDGKIDDAPDEGLLCWQSLLQMHSPTVSPRDLPVPRSLDWNSSRLQGFALSAIAFIGDACTAAAGYEIFAPARLGNATQAVKPDKADSDLFPAQGSHNRDESPGWSFFKSAPFIDWIILFVVCCVLFIFDLLVLQRFESSFRTHMWTLVFWLFVAVAFDVLTYFRFGKDMALNWCTGYLLEWILSMDNLFVFHIIFETYKTPEAQTHKAVFLGIVGAVITRMVFFMAVSELLNAFQWVRYPFGALLIWSGIQAARGEDEDEDVKDTYVVRACKWVFGKRLLDEYDGEGRLLVPNKDGTVQFTLLVLVVAIIEFSDVVFALDSVSAKIAQIPQQYIAFSSTCIAMYGLRALFFIVKDLVQMFELLQYGLCLILVWIGLELMLSHWLHVGAGAVCVLIASIFAVFTIASVARRRVLGYDSKEPSTKSNSRESADDAFEAQATASKADSAKGNKESADDAFEAQATASKADSAKGNKAIEAS